MPGGPMNGVEPERCEDDIQPEELGPRCVPEKKNQGTSAVVIPHESDGYIRSRYAVSRP